jgi:hypothetical protein
MVVSVRSLRLLSVLPDHGSHSGQARDDSLHLTFARLFPTDEEQFANLQVWKNLLWACREKAWSVDEHLTI